MPRGPTYRPGCAVAGELVPTAAPEGLTSAEAARRLREHGPNETPPPPRRRLVARVWAQVRDPMILLLLAAGSLTAALYMLRPSVASFRIMSCP